MSEDPLARLVVKKQEVDRGLLADVLIPFVRLGEGGGSIVLTPAFSDLTNEAKVLVYLLARKAAVSLALPNAVEGAAPKEIAAATGIKYDSVKPTLSALFRKTFVAKKDGSYQVPDHAILLVKHVLKGGE